MSNPTIDPPTGAELGASPDGLSKSAKGKTIKP
jgi:hypothetical protein